MAVCDCCQHNPVTATAAETLREGAIRMDQADVGCLVVVDEKRRPVGVVTDRDLVVNGMRRGLDPDETPLSAVMHEDVITVREDAQVVPAFRAMRRHGIRRLVVIDVDGCASGVLSVDDALQVIAQEVGGVAAAVQAQISSAPPVAGNVQGKAAQ